MRTAARTWFGSAPDNRRRRHWAIQGVLVGVVLVMACGWVGGGATPTPAAAPSPSPSPASGASLPPSSIVPSPSPSPSPSPVAGGGESYTIAEGDTLATVASRFYGDPNEWRRIYDANRQVIGENPDAVRIGTVLRIPPKQ